MNKGTAKRIAVMIRRRLFSLLKYPKFPLDTLEDIFALLCFYFCFSFLSLTSSSGIFLMYISDSVLLCRC